MAVVGSDGNVPVQDLTQPNRSWFYGDIYFGGAGLNKYVPKVNDAVYQYNANGVIWYRVVSLNELTLIPILEMVVADSSAGGLTEADILNGVGPGTQSDTYRVLFDNSVFPYELCVDKRLTIGGTETVKCRIFRGADISATGTVISRSNAGVGGAIVDYILLEVDSTHPSAQKPVKVGYSSISLTEGELVTAVFYTATEAKVSSRQLLVKHSSFIRGAAITARTIQGIHLESPYISNASSRNIDVPLDASVESLNLTAVVTYSNGEQKRTSPTTNGFTIGGLDLYTSSQVGATTDVVLMYRPASDGSEVSNNLTAGGVVVEEYTLRTVSTVSSYEIKLYAYPYYKNGAYTLKWFAYSQDRDLAADVTANVVYTNGTSFIGAINASNQAEQALSVRLPMNTINASYSTINHSQSVTVRLDYVPFSDGNNTWATGLAISDHVLYDGIYATRASMAGSVGKVYISQGLTTRAAWLNAVYEKTYPILNTLIEDSAPTPTHFKLMKLVGTAYVTTQAYDIDDVIAAAGVATNFAVADLDTIFIKFLKQKSDGGFQDLSMGAFLVKPYGT